MFSRTSRDKQSTGHAAVGLIVSLCLAIGTTAAADVDQGHSIPVRFTLDRSGYVTLVIEDAEGRRIRNLLADTWFEAGMHTIAWDGYDEGQKKDRSEGLDTHRRLVEPGTYQVRGLVHGGLGLRYQTSVQGPGTPPWHTHDRSGAWLADHTPPADVIFLPQGTPEDPQPQVMISAPTAEAGHSVMFLDLDGRKLWGGKIRGWRSGRNLAADHGPDADSRHHIYAMVEERDSAWLYGLRNTWDADEEHDRFVDLIRLPVPEIDDDAHWVEMIARRGMAVYNGLLVLSYHHSLNRLMVFDMKAGVDKAAALSSIELEGPRGLAFDRAGRLYAVSDRRVLRFDRPKLREGDLGPATVLIDGSLEDPGRLMVTDDERLLVADLGSSHQIKVFDTNGNLLRTIGKAGGPQLGLYDERRMARPAGMAIDGNGKLWVAELDYGPKRISRWDAATGEFDCAWYGPPKYGGGGHLDPRDRTRFNYSSGLQGIEFKVDWENGSSVPRAIYWRSNMNDDPGRCPDSVVYVDGRRFLTNNFFGPAYFAGATIDVYVQNERTGIAERVAHVGRPPTEKDEEPRLLGLPLAEHPELEELVKVKAWLAGEHRKGRGFIWSDLNRNGRPEPKELQFYNWRNLPGRSDFPSLNIHEDLSVTTSDGHYLPLSGITDKGVPVWDFSEVQVPAPAVHAHLSNSLIASDGTYINTMGKYVQQRQIQAYQKGEKVWHINGYRNARIAEHPGQLINAQRHIGYPFEPTTGEGGKMFILNGYKGSLYVLTTDGLIVTDLGGDERVVPHLALPEVKPGTIISGYSFKSEHFWPASVQMQDGTIYVIAGKESSNICELTGCETIRRLTPWRLTVRADQLAGLPQTKVVPGEERQIERTATVRIVDQAPQIDGDLTDWADAQWLAIDSRRDMEAALQVHGRTLYAAWRTAEPRVLNNDAGDGWQYAFTTGGGLDLMLRTASGDATSNKVLPGDTRLFVTRLNDPLNGRVLAVRFQQIGGPGETIDYTSPVGAVQFESIADVSSQVHLAQQAGRYELAVPLALLGINIEPGMTTRGDIGVLLGDGSDIYARLYWSNKGTSMTSDIPSEARLEPSRWGELYFSK